jgi:hypothetical protein
VGGDTLPYIDIYKIPLLTGSTIEPGGEANGKMRALEAMAIVAMMVLVLVVPRS